jgi:hypothetical protein
MHLLDLLPRFGPSTASLCWLVLRMDKSSFMMDANPLRNPDAEHTGIPGLVIEGLYRQFICSRKCYMVAPGKSSLKHLLDLLPRFGPSTASLCWLVLRMDNSKRNTPQKASDLLSFYPSALLSLGLASIMNELLSIRTSMLSIRVTKSGIYKHRA